VSVISLGNRASLRNDKTLTSGFEAPGLNRITAEDAEDTEDAED